MEWMGLRPTVGVSSSAASAGGCVARSVASESLLLCSVTASDAGFGAGAASDAEIGTGTSFKAEEGAGEDIELVAAVDGGGRDVCSEVDAVSVRDIEAEWGIFVRELYEVEPAAKRADCREEKEERKGKQNGQQNTIIQAERVVCLASNAHRELLFGGRNDSLIKSLDYIIHQPSDGSALTSFSPP
ncbi:hypothetical protein BDZ89DRAFT_103662 [Hymenopellis radicata]|nr:hypothetical protein BDZ89DRAFT_103662 [Hymenopellis radicata]